MEQEEDGKLRSIIEEKRRNILAQPIPIVEEVQTDEIDSAIKHPSKSYESAPTKEQDLWLKHCKEKNQVYAYYDDKSADGFDAYEMEIESVREESDSEGQYTEQLPVLTGIENSKFQFYTAHLSQVSGNRNSLLILQKGDWNKRFQNIIEEIRSFTNSTRPEKMVSVYYALITLAQDFDYSAK